MSDLQELRSGARQAVLTAILLAVASVAALAPGAGAQGGGMGGFGSPGGGMGGGHGRGGYNRPNAPVAAAPDVSKHFDELGSLKDALKHVDGLSKDQKQSLSDIERSYTWTFKSMGHRAQQMVDSAHAAHGPADHERIDSLRKEATALRNVEFATARKVLSTDPQRVRFDQNVTEIRDKEAKREQDMADHPPPDGMPPGGPGGGIRGGMHP